MSDNGLKMRDSYLIETVACIMLFQTVLNQSNKLLIVIVLRIHEFFRSLS